MCISTITHIFTHTVCNKIDASHKSYSMCVLVWTQGNFCAQGIIHVLKSHKCNPICEALKLRSLVKTFKSPEELGTQMPNAAAPDPLTRGCLPTRLHAKYLESSRYTYCAMHLPVLAVAATNQHRLALDARLLAGGWAPVVASLAETMASACASITPHSVHMDFSPAPGAPHV